MVSNINPLLPADGAAASKLDLRTNLQAAKDEIEALQAGGGGGGSTTFTGLSDTPSDYTGAEGLYTKVQGGALVFATTPTGGTSYPIGGISVKDPPYNATGDGVTDDLAALQAASDAAQTAGVPLWIPPGVYRITGTWNIGGPAYILDGTGGYTYGINNYKFSKAEWEAGTKLYAADAPSYSGATSDIAAAKPKIDVWGSGPATTVIWGDFTTGATEDDKRAIIAVWMKNRYPSAGQLTNVQVGAAPTIGNFTIVGRGPTHTTGASPTFTWTDQDGGPAYKQVGLFSCLTTGRFINIHGIKLHCLLWLLDCYGAHATNIQSHQCKYTVNLQQFNGGRADHIYDFGSWFDDSCTVMVNGHGAHVNHIVSQHADTCVMNSYGYANCISNVYYESYNTDQGGYGFEIGCGAGSPWYPQHSLLYNIHGFRWWGSGGPKHNYIRFRDAIGTVCMGMHHGQGVDATWGSIVGTLSDVTFIGTDFARAQFTASGGGSLDNLKMPSLTTLT